MLCWFVLGVVLRVPAATPTHAAPAAPTQSGVEEIEVTGRYYLGDNDTRIDGHRLALMDAKRTALEKAGTYVESISEVKDFQLTRDDIRTYTAGIVEVTETDEPKYELIGKQERCTVTVKVRVDKDEVAKKIAALRKDKEATQQLKEARANTVENEKKVAELNRQLKKAKKGSPAAKRAKESRDHALAGIDAATLRAQATGAAAYSKESWQRVKEYVNHNVNLSGCMPFRKSAAAHPPATARTAGLPLLGVPAVAFVMCRPRLRRRRPPVGNAVNDGLGRKPGSAEERVGKENT